MTSYKYNVGPTHKGKFRLYYCPAGEEEEEEVLGVYDSLREALEASKDHTIVNAVMSLGVESERVW